MKYLSESKREESRSSSGRLNRLRDRRRAKKAKRARGGVCAAAIVSIILVWGTAFAAPHISDRAASTTLDALLQANPAFAQAYTTGSRFVTGEKNSVELCNFALKADEENWNYVYGGKGQRMNSSLIASIVSSNLSDTRSPYLRPGYVEQTQAQATGNRATDCSGLVMDFMWWAGDDSDPIRSLCPSIGMYNANNMLEAAVEKGPVETIPEIPGLLVHSNGHVGIYIGSGEVIEARGVKFGVVKTQLANRSFRYWSKSPWVDYEVSGIYKVGDRTVFLDNGEDIGQERWVSKYVYGDLAQGSTYVPVCDESATFKSEEPAVFDVEEPTQTEEAVPQASAPEALGQPDAVPETPPQTPSVLEEAAPTAPQEVTQPESADVAAPESTPVPTEVPLVDRILEVIDTLPHDELQGYLFEGHWYLILEDETGVHTVLNDPRPEEPDAGETTGAEEHQDA